jgi:hypothetical protein
VLSGYTARTVNQQDPCITWLRQGFPVQNHYPSLTGWWSGAAEASYLGPRRPIDALLEKYAQDTLDTEPPPASASDDEFRAWRAHVRERVGSAIGEVRRDDEPDRKHFAHQLADLPDRERVWGRNAGIKARGAANKRPNDVTTQSTTPAQQGSDSSVQA